MTFQIKNFASITASIINWMRATQSSITDFNVGSVARTIVEGPAAEIDELYQQMFIGLKEAIPVSVYNSFNFDRIVESTATGLIRVTITSSISDTLIPESTIFTPSIGSVTYSSNADVIILAGSTYADVLVTCNTGGAVGNITSGINFTLSPDISGFVSASNLSAFAGGIDAETDADRKSRFNAYVSSLNHGTIDAIKYGLNLSYLTDTDGNITERVASSNIIEPWLTDNMQPLSLVNCYVHNGVGSTSSDLVARASEVIYGYYDNNGVAVPGWKAAGVKVVVYAATEVTVAVTGALTAVTGYDKPTLITAAYDAIYAYILSRGIGVPVIRSELIQLIMDIEGVFDISLSLPSANVSASNSTKLMPGTITIS